MKIINYLSLLFIFALFAGCTIDLRGGVPKVDFGEDVLTPQIEKQIVEDVTPGKEIEIPKDKPKEKEDEKPVVIKPEIDDVLDDNLVYIPMSEVQKHIQFNDCWIVLEDKVYDAKILISTHPSGRMVINYCGKDATNFIKTQLFKGDVNFLENAKGYLKQSYKGELE